MTNGGERQYPDPAAPRVDEHVAAGLDVLLEAVDTSAEGTVYGADIGGPDVGRELLAMFVLDEVVPDASAARTAARHIDEFVITDVHSPLEGAGLDVLRAALELHPEPPAAIRRVDAALEWRIAAWSPPADEVERLVALVGVARFISASGWDRGALPRSAAALGSTIEAFPRCPSAQDAVRSDATLWSAAALVESFTERCSADEAAPVEPAAAAQLSELDTMVLLEVLRSAADRRSLGHAGPVSPDVVQEIDSRLAGTGDYALRAVLPMQTVAVAVATARDAGTDLDVGDRQRALARAVAASGGAVPDVLGRGSVIDGVFTRLVRRWVGGSEASAARSTSDQPPSVLARTAAGLFDPPHTADRAVQSRSPAEPRADASAETARLALDALVSATAGSCHTGELDVLGRWLDIRHARTGLLDALEVVESGALTWAVLGVQALHACGYPEASSLAAQFGPVVGAGAAADLRQGDAADVLRAWASAELACIRGGGPVESVRSDLRGRGLTPGLGTLQAVVEHATESATVGVGTAAYVALRLRRVAFDGCGPNLVEVLRAW